MGSALNALENLEHLDVGWNSIEAFGSVVIARLFMLCPNFRHLDMSHNPITDRGIAAIAAMLYRARSLVTLDLTGCGASLGDLAHI